MNRLLTLAFSCAVAFAASLSQAAEREPCPEAGSVERYVTTRLLKEEAASGQVRVYYRLLREFDATKPTLLIINGGPGGDHSLINSFGPLAGELNIVGFDHRGLGCTKIVSRGDTEYAAGTYAITRAADDIEAIRADLLGTGTWHVYGVSYGGMLAQRYAIQYPKSVRTLILDSTFYESHAIEVGRRQYVALFIDTLPEVKALFAEIIAKYPDAHDNLLRMIWGLTYDYRGRTVEIKDLFAKVLAATSAEEARKLYASPVYLGPFEGMSPAIICEEIWDHPAVTAEDQFYFAVFGAQCPKYLPYRQPMAWEGDLRALKVKTFIWAGGFDPVTPASVSEKMHGMIAGSLFFKNDYAGHGLFWEKRNCALKLMRQFWAAGDEHTIMATVATNECQGVPTIEVDDYVPWRAASRAGAHPSF